MKAMIAAALICVAGQAQALSCPFGDGAAAYLQAKDHGDSFRAAIGTLTWADPGQSGGFQMDFEGQEYDVLARFRGEVLAANGARTPVDQKLRVRASCVNGDCGYAYGENEMLTFLHDTPEGVVMNAPPCQSYPRTPNPQLVTQVQSCVDGGACVAGYGF